MAYEIVSRSPGAVGVISVPRFGEAPAVAKRPPGLPPFKFVCDQSCLFPFSCASLEALLGKRISGAINLARNAANRLETLLRNPKSTKAEIQLTAKIFQDVFGKSHSDFWELPCCPLQKMPAAKMAADRFRTVEKELKTRMTLYKCTSAADCAQNISRAREERPRHPADIMVPDVNALANLCRDEVLLCPPFWQLKKPEWQEGTILHEMFHLSFGLTCAWFQHDQNEKTRNSAYCYEVFALKAAGRTPDQVSIDKCKDILSRNGS